LMARLHRRRLGTRALLPAAPRRAPTPTGRGARHDGGARVRLGLAANPGAGAPRGAALPVLRRARSDHAGGSRRPHRRQLPQQRAGEPTPAVQPLPRRPHGPGPVIRPAAQPGRWPMKIVGYALVTLGAVALVRGLWLLTPVAG